MSFRPCLCRIRQLAEQAGLSRNPVKYTRNWIVPMNRGDDRLTFEIVS